MIAPLTPNHRWRDTDCDGEIDEELDILTDRFGNVRALSLPPKSSGASGVILEHYDYTPFGRPLSRPLADLSGDGKVDGDDDNAMTAAYGAYTSSSANYDPRADLDHDGDVDSNDHYLWESSPLVGYNALKTYDSTDRLGVGDWPSSLSAEQTEGLDLRIGYRGYQWDPMLKTYHCRNRDYDPVSQRWSTPDPIGAAGGDSNWYGYVGNRPALGWDPMGLDTNWFQDRWLDVTEGATQWWGNVTGSNAQDDQRFMEGQARHANNLAEQIKKDYCDGKIDERTARRLLGGVTSTYLNAANELSLIREGESHYQRATSAAILSAAFIVGGWAATPLIGALPLAWQAGIGIALSGVGVVGAGFGVYTGIEQIRNADNGWDVAGGVLTIIGSAAGGAAGVLGGVQTAQTWRSALRAQSLPPNPCFVAGTLVWTQEAEAPIESLRVGDRVQTSRTIGKSASAEETIVPSDYSVIELELVDGKDSAQNVTIELLRPKVWLHRVDADVGKVIWIDLDHARIHGHAVVKSVSPCPDIPPGQGRIVTATIRTTNAVVMDAKFEGCSETIGVTPAHPFWSEDQQAWVSAAKLVKGERVASAKLGSTRLVEIAPRHSRATVYNVEVADDHEYLVGTIGLRVHNDCPGAPVGITSNGRTIPGSTPDQRALRQLVDEVTLGGRRPLSVDDANTVLDWGAEIRLPGLRAKPGDVATPSN